MGTVKNELGDNYGAPFSYFFYLRQRHRVAIETLYLENNYLKPGFPTRNRTKGPSNARP